MINTIIFDLGGVLIDWNPRYLYRKIFDNEEEIQNFLNTICTPDWNEEQDGGRSLKEATETLVKQHPEYEEEIRAYYTRWPEMLGSAISGAVDIFKNLKDSGSYKVYALTNWSAETFPIAQEKYPFLNRFNGVVVSGTEKVRKPFPKFYNILLNRYAVKANEALFIDDNLRNINAAKALGIDCIHFTTAESLKQQLKQREIHV